LLRCKLSVSAGALQISLAKESTACAYMRLVRHSGGILFKRCSGGGSSRRCAFSEFVCL
jgi:hypothetical protein